MCLHNLPASTMALPKMPACIFKSRPTSLNMPVALLTLALGMQKRFHPNHVRMPIGPIVLPSSTSHTPCTRHPHPLCVECHTAELNSWLFQVLPEKFVTPTSRGWHKFRLQQIQVHGSSFQESVAPDARPPDGTKKCVWPCTGRPQMCAQRPSSSRGAGCKVLQSPQLFNEE